MQRHTKIYMDAFGYDVSDFIPCELCGERAVDINHIKARGMGGSKNMDYIENLMGTCRRCHELMGDKKEVRHILQMAHERAMQKHKIDYNADLLFAK